MADTLPGKLGYVENETSHDPSIAEDKKLLFTTTLQGNYGIFFTEGSRDQFGLQNITSVANNYPIIHNSTILLA